MTDNHLLLYRLAELMFEHEQHILPVDLLFDDEQIGDFVKSIQIDSSYQQMLLEGVLTESVRDEKLYVDFTVEGYFHFVLGEVIYKRTEGLGAEALKQIVEGNKLNGANEGVEQCLIRDVLNGDLNRLVSLIDSGGELLEVSIIPLAFSFININSHLKTELERSEANKHQISKVLDALLREQSDNDIEVLTKAIEHLEKIQNNDVIRVLYNQINSAIMPNNLKWSLLYVKSIEHIPEILRKIKLNKLLEVKILEKNSISGSFYYYLGELFYFLGDYNNSIKYHNLSLSIRLKAHGDLHASIADSYTSLGGSWMAKDEYKKAIKFFQKALSMDLNIHGLYHPMTGISYNNLGLAFFYNGNNNKSLKYHNKSLDISSKNYGFQHPSTGISYNNLGAVWANKGNYKKAIEYYEKSLVIDLKVYGELHPDTSISLINLGRAWRKKGKYEKAIKYIEKSLAIRLKVFGAQHPDTGSSYDSLGDAYKDMQDWKKARANYEKALAIRLKVFGAQHPDTGFSYNSLGNAYKDMQDWKKARTNYEKAHLIFYNSLGEDHPHTMRLKEKLTQLNDI